jgi:hypothetical protein
MSMAESFGKSAFARFINSPAGRAFRIIVGLVLIAWGYVHGGSTGVILMVVGLVPLAAGLFDLCVISALLGGPLKGARVGKGTPAA